MMNQVHSFPPLANQHAKVLILGSMPGIASLKAQQYYAHPRNAFWMLMSVIVGIDEQLPYAQRCQQLLAKGVAVWDVLQTCTRTTSLDSDIIQSSAITNDFLTLFQLCQGVKAVFFNGATAEKFYLKHVQPSLPKPYDGLVVQRLPSTSPAHAALSFEQKLSAWQVIDSYL